MPRFDLSCTLTLSTLILFYWLGNLFLMIKIGFAKLRSPELLWWCLNIWKFVALNIGDSFAGRGCFGEGHSPDVDKWSTNVQVIAKLWQNCKRFCKEFRIDPIKLLETLNYESRKRGKYDDIKRAIIGERKLWRGGWDGRWGDEDLERRCSRAAEEENIWYRQVTLSWVSPFIFIKRLNNYWVKTNWNWKC